MTDTAQMTASEKDAEVKSESPKKNRTLSTSTSSFEALDPHDPNISRLANTMFQKCSEFLLGIYKRHFLILCVNNYKISTFPSQVS